MNTKLLTSFILIGLSGVVACGGDSDKKTGSPSGMPTGLPGPGTPPAAHAVHPDFVGPSAAHAVSGVVTEISKGTRIADATVTVVGGTQTVTTDAKGEFLFTDLPEGTVSLSIVKEGFAPGFAATESAANARAAVVSLKKEGRSRSYTATEAATLSEETDNGPYAVIFEPSSLDTTETSLNVSVTPLDPTTEASALPGDLIAGGASPSPLDAVTFAEFTIKDSKGKRINLKSGSSAIVELPIPLALRSTYPLDSKIHCYSYNPETAKWEDFVEGTVALSTVDKTTPVLRASIRHFSWYGGAPNIQDQDCSQVQVFSKYTGKPLEGAVVKARPGLEAVTDSHGLAFVTVKKGSKINYTATKTYTDTYVDDSGNLIKMAGSKVIEFGRVETDDELSLLTQGPCPGTAPKADASKAIRLETGPIGNGSYSYEIAAAIQAGGVFVSVERGLDDGTGNLDNQEPAPGSIVTLQINDAAPVGLNELTPGGYIAVQAGKPGDRYTVAVDADGSGSVDATASCVAAGTLTWVNPTDGGTYPSAAFEASWSDSLTGTKGYDPNYLVQLIGSDQVSGGSTGKETTFRPSPALMPGTYSGLLFNMFGTSTFSGVGVNGEMICASTSTNVSFTIE